MFHSTCLGLARRYRWTILEDCKIQFHHYQWPDASCYIRMHQMRCKLDQIRVVHIMIYDPISFAIWWNHVRWLESTDEKSVYGLHLCVIKLRYICICTYSNILSIREHHTLLTMRGYHREEDLRQQNTKACFANVSSRKILPLPLGNRMTGWPLPGVLFRQFICMLVHKICSRWRAQIVHQTDWYPMKITK